MEIDGSVSFNLMCKLKVFMVLNFCGYNTFSSELKVVVWYRLYMYMYLRKTSLNILCPPFLLPASFSEMPTNNFIESSFWNFDALFQPQQHPARDAHDTFFLKGTSEGGVTNLGYLIKRMSK